MTFACSGESACNPSQVAQVLVTIDGEQDMVTSNGSPVCINNTVGTVNGQSCFHFWTGSDSGENNQPVINFERFACCQNAGISCTNNGEYETCIFLINGEPWWQYLSYVAENSTFYIGVVNGVNYFAGCQQTTDETPLSPHYSQGSCQNCLAGCTVTIQDCNGNQIYNKSGQVCNTSYNCDGCPDGTIQCNCNDYPGYCCLPCEAIEEEIQIMIDQAKSILLQKDSGQTTLT